MMVRLPKEERPIGSVAAKGSAARSLGAAVHAGVRAAILGGRFEPGARLSPRELAVEFQVSLSVVREALSRLAEQGLVVAMPQLGFSVVDLNIDDLRDLTRVRVLIEGEALRDAVLHADVDYESRLVAAHHRLARTPLTAEGTPATITEDWASAHAVFHDTLISACISSRLREMAARLRDQSELYRRWSGPFDTAAEPRDVAREHRELMEAALDHDAERAVDLLAAHFGLTTSILIDYATTHDATGSEASA
ncbi:GntR family transcriptional regulator [Nocardia sp. alder85J]|uniref:GntR family transcriptional regulator n=1 Tax=Nocardia sp. alder85J TaxID=2862949 RepID=UPI001CD60810|nr:GntR family transcriptional regulator [Nocardia sp. alder85J]MCX4098441.1 GntR family transcriptional regulator [Nocardia sp. alder85J]